jgi:hypothetical protein
MSTELGTLNIWLLVRKFWFHTWKPKFQLVLLQFEYLDT